MLFLNALIVFISVSFFIYGYACLSKEHLKTEFKRYGLGRFRVLVGCLEILGALGLLLGLRWGVILMLSSAGLSLLMLLGFIVRLKIRDGFWLSLPSFFYMALCFYIFTRVI